MINEEQSVAAKLKDFSSPPSKQPLPFMESKECFLEIKMKDSKEFRRARLEFQGFRHFPRLQLGLWHFHMRDLSSSQHGQHPE